MKQPALIATVAGAAVVIFVLGITLGRISSPPASVVKVASTRTAQARTKLASTNRRVQHKPVAVATSETTAIPEPTANPYPYVESHDSVDMWDSEDDMCSGFRASAEAIVQGRDAGKDFVDALPGHSDLTNGTRVAVEGHADWQCPDTDTVFNMTKVETSDGNVGYIMEGSLSKDP